MRPLFDGPHESSLSHARRAASLRMQKVASRWRNRQAKGVKHFCQPLQSVLTCQRWLPGDSLRENSHPQTRILRIVGWTNTSSCILRAHLRTAPEARNLFRQRPNGNPGCSIYGNALAAGIPRSIAQPSVGGSARIRLPSGFAPLLIGQINPPVP